MTEKHSEARTSCSDVKALLLQPYVRTVVPQEDGTYHAEIMEFPGCIATGETAAQALAALEGVAKSWLEAVLDAGQQVPQPLASGDFSGKLMLRMPRSLHRKVATLAGRDGVSLNQFIVACLAESVGSARPAFQEVAPKGSSTVTAANTAKPEAGLPWKGRLAMDAILGLHQVRYLDAQTIVPKSWGEDALKTFSVTSGGLIHTGKESVN